MIKFDYLSAIGLGLAAKIQRELPPNFLKLVYNQIATVDSRAKIILILALFFSFNFYSYIYISGGLMELKKERLSEEKLNEKWNDLFAETDSFFVYQHSELGRKEYFVNFDSSLRSTKEKGKIKSIWAPGALILRQSYNGFVGRMAVPMINLANIGAATLETIAQLRNDLSVPFFELLKRKPNTSLFDNILYFLWLPIDLDVKQRLLRYKQKELGEIVLEMFHKKAIHNSIEQYQMLVSRSVLMDNSRWRRFLIKNTQFLVSKSKSR